MKVVLAALVAAAALVAPCAQAAEVQAGRKILAPFMAAPLVENGAMAAPTLVETEAQAGMDEREDLNAGEESEDTAEISEESGADEDSEESSEQGPGYLPATNLVSPTQQAQACGGSNPCEKQLARVVSSLSTEYRPFVDPNAGKEKSALTALRDLAPEDRDDHGDAVLRGLFEKLVAVEKEMTSERDWVTKVYQLIDHYRMSALRVKADIRHKGGAVYRLEKMIHARQEELVNGSLKEKMKNVNAAMAELESKTNDVAKSRQDMLTTKRNMQQHILELRHELQRLGAPVYRA